MALRINPGVRLHGIGNEITWAAKIAADVFSEHGYDCIVTSAVDGTHSRGSLHYIGHAIDLRTRHVKADADPHKLRTIVLEIGRRLGDDFDVVNEATHLHIEFQPKEPY